MDSKVVRKSYEKLLAKKLKIEEEIKNLRAVCPHELATTKLGSDTGNWCKSDDAYWVEVSCPSCGFTKMFDSVEHEEGYKIWSRK